MVLITIVNGVWGPTLQVCSLPFHPGISRDFPPRHVPGTAEVEDRQHWAFALPVPAEGQDAARRVVLHLEDLEQPAVWEPWETTLRWKIWGYHWKIPGKTYVN